MAANSNTLDARLMAACIRYAARHLGRTGTNPSVGTLLVQLENGKPLIVGRGVTAIGGRPHAETIAIEQAGDRALGATAYVTLEPCAHHASTPPCAQALIDAGISRVVTAYIDPDGRVDGKGHAMLKAAGIKVDAGLLGDMAYAGLAGYLMRVEKKRPQVILKLAVSADGMLGLAGKGQVAITGDVSRAQVHLMRSLADAILIGSGTALADDPDLTCRLPGLAARSPHRFVLDSMAKLSPASKLAATANAVPVSIVTGPDAPDHAKSDLAAKGVAIWAGDMAGGVLALPELLEDMAAQGISTLMVEGGAKTARSFLDADLVDVLALFVGPDTLGASGIASPVTLETLDETRFREVETALYGDDRFHRFQRIR